MFFSSACGIYEKSSGNVEASSLQSLVSLDSFSKQWFLDMEKAPCKWEIKKLKVFGLFGRKLRDEFNSL